MKQNERIHILPAIESNPESSASFPAGWLPEVVDIARAAGTAIMEIYARAELGETQKQDASPLTFADLAADRLIKQGLKCLSPEIPILSEEDAGIDFQERRHWFRFWLIDPLDGTREFIERNGQFTVNIALVEAGRPVLGVVHAPALGQMYFAAEGRGAYQAGQETVRTLKVAAEPAGKSLRVVASRSHSDAQTDAFLARIPGHDLRPMGSSLKFCLVAAGEADVYPRFGPTMEWDTAAAQCVVEQAGGVVCDFSGTPLRYNKPDLHNPQFLAVAPNLRQAMLDIFRNMRT